MSEYIHHKYKYINIYIYLLKLIKCNSAWNISRIHDDDDNNPNNNQIQMELNFY